MNAVQTAPSRRAPAWILAPHLPVPHLPHRLLVAIASTDGARVDRDFEDADAFLLYETDAEKTCYIGRQPCPLAGAAPLQRTRLLADCDLVLCSSISETCRQALHDLGIDCSLDFAGVPVPESMTVLQRFVGG